MFRQPAAVVVAVALCLAGLAGAQIAPAPFEPLNIMGPNPQDQFKDIKIEQHLDAQVPLDLMFRDESGSQVSLGELMDGKPTILALVYYACPSLCNVVLNGVEGVVDAMKYEIGKDYNVITVSIDPHETPQLAREKKAAHMKHMHRGGAENSWHFLVGTEESISRLASAAGFRYAYDPKTNQYAHAAGIMVMTPQGRLARYYYGVEYIPRDVEFGLIEASQGKIGKLVDQLTLLCFHYDPATGKYGFYVIGAMRIFAALMILGFATMYVLLYFRARRNKLNGGGDGTGGGSPLDPATFPVHEVRH